MTVSEDCPETFKTMVDLYGCMLEKHLEGTENCPSNYVRMAKVLHHLRHSRLLSWFKCHGCNCNCECMGMMTLYFIEMRVPKDGIYGGQ